MNGLRIIGICCFFMMPSGISLEVSIPATQKTQKITLGLLFVGSETADQKEIAPLVKKALEFKDQCTVLLYTSPSVIKKSELQLYRAKGCDYLCIISFAGQNGIDWHLFDCNAQTLLASKRVAKKGSHVRAQAYALADSLCTALTNDPGFFSTKIAYSKNVTHNGKSYKYICVADYDGSNEQILVDAPTISFAPRWNNDSARPLLFYSENTNTNTRMMTVDMKKKRLIASNFEGVNMQPAFAPNGHSVAYCATRGTGLCNIYCWSAKKLKRVTKNNGNNFGPTFNADGSKLYFSSDFETGKPRIYEYCFATEQCTAITHDGYCVSPSYCAVRNMLAYSKMVNGVMQLFTYDCATQLHRQLTFDPAQKEECCWSSCGTFLICSYENVKTSRIAAFNTLNTSYKYLTSDKAYCSYPSCSGLFSHFIQLEG